MVLVLQPQQQNFSQVLVPVEEVVLKIVVVPVGEVVLKIVVVPVEEVVLKIVEVAWKILEIL